MSKSIIIALMLLSAVAQSQINTTRWIDHNGDGMADNWQVITGHPSILSNGNQFVHNEWPGGNGQVAIYAPNTLDNRRNWHTLQIIYRSNNTFAVNIRATNTCGTVIEYLPPSQKYNVVTLSFFAPSVNSLMLYNRMGMEYPWIELVSVIYDQPTKDGEITEPEQIEKPCPFPGIYNILGQKLDRIPESGYYIKDCKTYLKIKR